MEVFIRNIPFSASDIHVKGELAKVLHSQLFGEFNQPLPLNFQVFLHRPKQGSRGLTGILTLAFELLGVKFLIEYGGKSPQQPVRIAGRQIFFDKGRKSPRADVVDTIRRLPFVDPVALQEKEARLQEFAEQAIRIQTVQFGWECRDGAFSPEWERDYSETCTIQFEGERREIRIMIAGTEDTQIIAISFSQIEYTNVNDSSGDPAIYLSLCLSPTYESELPRDQLAAIERSHQLMNPRWKGSVYEIVPRRRLSSLDDPGHRRVAPYACYALRLICKHRSDLNNFRRLAQLANLQNPQNSDYPVEHRQLFSEQVLSKLSSWLQQHAIHYWQVTYQVEALLRNAVLDAKEVLDLIGRIELVLKKLGPKDCAMMLLQFRTEAKILWTAEHPGSNKDAVFECFSSSLKDFTKRSQKKSNERGRTDGNFDCYHVIVTPTTYMLEGPFSEKSNRVIRSYPGGQFLRVVFSEESRLQFRFDRQIDGPRFVKERVGGVLHGGLRVGGKKFDFLAYSQSALKEHAVWFVTPFLESATGEEIDACTIIDRLGSFDNLEFDRRLIYCPARYGARISQAFTTTDASITTAEIEEIIPIKDIERNKSCFTDGIGTMSSEVARDIWKALTRAKGRSFRRSRVTPRAFQIRFMGSKGMLSVNYKLQGRLICLRPSMIKFEAPDSPQVEIARAFDKPGKMFLNRPLIMLLEGLGVRAPVFMKLQDDAVRDVKKATESLRGAARLLETHGLGTSFRLTSVLLNLDKLGLQLKDRFYHKMLDLTVNHILRELKHHARIPVPGWNLVGVADEHNYLEENEVFICVHQTDAAPIYLEGMVTISRSPTIHPGDIQLVKAIGQPPKNSPFAQEPLENTIVFSTKGQRSLPSCLGGGDLDGDTYNVTDFKPLHPTSVAQPAGYEPAPRNELDRPSTMSDVADFVIDYIVSDILGIIAVNWLIIADQSERSIFDLDCIELARLHSDAVDYPKSGRPVPLSKVPRLKFKHKPDWNAPETIKPGADFYESQRAIGKLYRAIDLEDLQHKYRNIPHRKLPEDTDISDLESGFRRMSLEPSDSIQRVVKARVSEFIYVDDISVKNLYPMLAVFKDYAFQLQYICSTHSLSYFRSAPLTEEEAVIGTIAAKSSQPRFRKNQISSLREKTAELIARVREDIVGDDDSTDLQQLKRAWAAWQLSVLQVKQDVFGAWSFWFICLGAIFETIKSIEDEERVDRHRR
ncbi:RdRP-domain-containing protein [Rickenella mellea]|uniref:RNA-dependent RNA polymerase n=1 Tax=Rickenella mellea TaxID=50990 RepID=A0A4Y7QM11_9AGAM|nr:RdRP-domain-containing protein [Rickenella mellea]